MAGRSSWPEVDGERSASESSLLKVGDWPLDPSTELRHPLSTAAGAVFLVRTSITFPPGRTETSPTDGLSSAEAGAGCLLIRALCCIWIMSCTAILPAAPPTSLGADMRPGGVMRAIFLPALLLLLTLLLLTVLLPLVLAL